MPVFEIKDEADAVRIQDAMSKATAATRVYSMQQFGEALDSIYKGRETKNQ
jgi:hypothetical protein